MADNDSIRRLHFISGLCTQNLYWAYIIKDLLHDQ